MYLSDREMAHAILCGRLIVEPPTKIGPTSIDLHLDSFDQARVWDIDALREHNKSHGLRGAELRIAQIVSDHFDLFQREFPLHWRFAFHRQAAVALA